MAETLKTLRRSIEDLIKAYHKLKGTDIKGSDYDMLKQLEEKIKGISEVVDFSEFVSGQASISKVEITSSNVENIQGQSNPAIPFVLIANNLNLFEDGKRYLLVADFNILSAVAPPYVQIKLKNDSNNVYICKSKEVPITERRASIEFTYKERAGETIKFIFEVGGNIDCEVEWKNIKVYRLEKEYTEEQKKVALRLLDEHVESARAYINAIRNKRGNISIPEAKEKDEAVNLQLLHNRVNIAINKLRDEINEKLKEEEKERKEADKKFISTEEFEYSITNDSGFEMEVKNTGGNITLKTQLILFGFDFNVVTRLPVYFDINAIVDELKNKGGVTSNYVKSEAENIAREYFVYLSKNGYTQLPGMKNPAEAFPFINTLASRLYWEEVGRSGNSILWQLKEKTIFDVPPINPPGGGFPPSNPSPTPNPFPIIPGR